MIAYLLYYFEISLSTLFLKKTTLTNALAKEIIQRGRVPFYCAAWSNVRSVRNAIKSGFRPAWVEMTAKPMETVEGMNRV